MTRARILDAAFELFSTHGYAQTGIRDVSREAGVAASLVQRYFGSKAALFRDALVHAIYSRGFFTLEKEGFGERMARLVVRKEDARIPAMMVLAIADPESREVARRITRTVVLESLAEWLGEPNAQARALNMLILMNGFAIQTQHLLEEPVPPQSVRWFADALQAIVDNTADPLASDIA